MFNAPDFWKKPVVGCKNEIRRVMDWEWSETAWGRVWEGLTEWEYHDLTRLCRCSCELCL